VNISNAFDGMSAVSVGIYSEEVHLHQAATETCLLGNGHVSLWIFMNKHYAVIENAMWTYSQDCVCIA